jgi:hypothetical protein
MAETLYAFTDIEHGFADGKKLSLAAGDVFNPEGFSDSEIVALIQAGALSRVSPIIVEAPPLTTDDVADIMAPSEETAPTKPTK